MTTPLAASRQRAAAIVRPVDVDRQHRRLRLAVRTEAEAEAVPAFCSPGPAPLPAPLVPDDATLRVANPVEVRPDLLRVERGLTGHWALVEVQLGVDPDKQWRWLAATALLYDARGTMGDLLVITHDASVAAWARSIAQATGPGGTHLALRPRVLQLTRGVADRLLASGRPEMAVRAAWAVHDQKGRPAQKVVRAAFAQIFSPSTDPELRARLLRAMLSMLDTDPLNVLREMMMLSPESFPLDPEREALFQQIQAHFKERDEAWYRGQAAGLSRAVITVLHARGLVVDEASRTRIVGCTDSATLERWLIRAATTPTVAAVFAADA